jgi:hypothetical protein
VGVSKRRRLGWAIAIATTSGSAAWAADGPPVPKPADAARAEAPASYKLERPRLLDDGARPRTHKDDGLRETLKEAARDPDLLLRVDARASLHAAPYYSLEQQVAYFVSHEPSLVKAPEPAARAAPARIELATLEVHLPF